MEDTDEPEDVTSQYEEPSKRSQRRNKFLEDVKQFLSFPYESKAQFIGEYKKLYGGKDKFKDLFLLILAELEKAILESNVAGFKKLSTFIGYVTKAENPVTLGNYYNMTKNPFKTTNLVIFVCKHNQFEILDDMLRNSCEILSDLSVGINRDTILPEDEDENCHNAFYYAIRSGNVDLVDTLITKWPGNYFVHNLGALDSILSQAYEEVKLKNVLLSEKVEIFVENKLTSLRFFSKPSGQDKIRKDHLSYIKERIDLVLESIDMLKTEYLNKEVDEKFLFVTKFIAQNIHILKRRLKSTYDTLPWEEIEFCLVSFFSSRVKKQEINLFYNTILNKNKILMHLKIFGETLLEKKKYTIDEVYEIGRLFELPKLTREEVVANIVHCCPPFGTLYEDYQQIRDAYSLEKISDYIKLALSSDPNEKEGQLIITRVLQIIGEYVKNTLESPKLSSNTCELLLLKLPKNTREVIIDLRDSLSHAYSLGKRTKIVENTDLNFFIGVQNDVKVIGDTITDILYKKKIQMIKILLQKVVGSENVEEIQEVVEILSNIELDDMMTESLILKEHEKLENFIKELNSCVPDKTSYEKGLFENIYSINNDAKTKSKNIKWDYVETFLSLKNFAITLDKDKINFNIINVMKALAVKTLKNVSFELEVRFPYKIANLVEKICHSSGSRIPSVELNKMHRIYFEIFCMADLKTDEFIWIRELRDKLGLSEASSDELTNVSNMTETKYNKQLVLKISELKSILQYNHKFNDVLIENLSSYKKNKKLQAAVEMLVLDILSILGELEETLENNLLFLDDNSPLLTGKCLRNHLAHDNSVVDLLLSDSSMAVFLNAEKLITKNVVTSGKKMGKLVKDDPCKLKSKFDQDLETITNQKNMFVAIEAGNIDDLEMYLKKGADVNGRTVQLLTALHFAARSPNLEIVKYLLGLNLDVNVKDVNGQSPLHTAAAYGMANNVEFFIKETGLNVNSVDNSGRTPLHIAAKYGHLDTVESLLQNKAETKISDILKYMPLHHAVSNNHSNVVKCMLINDKYASILRPMPYYPLLFVAAEYGHLEMVNGLYYSGASVNAKNGKGASPLHAAALNGHSKVVESLIIKGSDINSTLSGLTPLHLAVESSHGVVAKLLLKHGANVDAADVPYQNTPLHYAAKDGNVEIVKILLKSNANANITTAHGVTPLSIAIECDHLRTVAYLLKFGADVSIKDENGATPLHRVALSGNREIAELLIKYGANVNAELTDKMTPLHVAAGKCHNDVIKLLVENKAKVNARSNDGTTPLHAVATLDRNNLETLSLLIKYGAEVNAKTHTKGGVTPLHIASINGNKDAIIRLLLNKAEVDCKDDTGSTPLLLAVAGGHIDATKVLLRNKAAINMNGTGDSYPLLAAVQRGSKELVEILLANGAHVNGNGIQSPLILAVKYNHAKIVQYLLDNGAEFNASHLFLAVHSSSSDITEILLKRKVFINETSPDGVTLLHLAAQRGDTKVVNALIGNGAIVDALAVDGSTPLCGAVHGGHTDVVDVLIDNGANPNLMIHERGGPLHIAAEKGHVDIFNTLLKNGANVNAKDNLNRTALELAVGNRQLEVVKWIFKFKKVDIDGKGNGGYTLLHIGSQEGSLEIVKFLIDKGCDINASNDDGSKPIHIAAKSGKIDIVNFFLDIGLTVGELDAFGRTLLHYSAISGQVEVLKYLVSKGANCNATDSSGGTPMYIAAALGHKRFTEALLKNGAFYKTVTLQGKTPLAMTTDKDVIHLLSSIDKLFESVKRNCILELEKNLKAGAFIDARNSDGGTPLCFAAWKGYVEVTKILLQNKADPNTRDNKKFTPLHYAAKFSQLKIVKMLLSHGAVYNAVSNTGKTPSDLATNRDIKGLFKLISDSFENVKKGNVSIVSDLSNVNDNGTIKAVMCARNEEKKPLIVVAIHSNFAKVEELKEIGQIGIRTQLKAASDLMFHKNYHGALSIFRDALNRRIDIMGSDNPGTWDIQSHIATVMFNQGIYQEAFNIFEDIFHKQKETLGVNDKATLNTRIMIFLVLHKLGKDEEAFDVFQELRNKEIEHLGFNHLESMEMQFNMALTLGEMGKYKEALEIHEAVFEKRKKALGPLDPATVSSQNNIAILLSKHGKSEDSLKAHQEVFDKQKKVLGNNHADTLRTFHKMGELYVHQERFPEALSVFLDILNAQKISLPWNHPDILSTQCNISHVHMRQGQWISALRVYRENLDQMKVVLGLSDPIVTGILGQIKELKYKLQLEGSDASEILQHLLTKMNNAVNKGEIEIVRFFLSSGFDANEKDTNGLTPLHFAASSGHIDIASLLINNGADVTKATNKGNTPLHTATSKANKDMVDILLKNVDPDELIYFVNTKTKGGSTAFHVAAKAGSIEIVKSLLAHGARCNVKNGEGKTPLDLCNDQEVADVIKSSAASDVLQNKNINDAVSKGDKETVQLLLAIGADANEKDSNGRTPLHFAVSSGRKDILNILINNGANVFEATYNGNTLLHAATSKSYKDIVDILLKHVNADKLEEFVNAKTLSVGNTGLHIAAEVGSIEIAKSLLAHGATCDVKNCEGRTPLDLCKYENVARLLKSNSAPVFSQKISIINAVQKGDIQTIERLLKSGAYVNEKGINGYTPLHVAASIGSKGIVNLLFINGASAFEVTNNGNTPLHTASSKSYKDIVDILLKHVSPDKIKDFVDAKTISGGTTALHVAAKCGSIEIVKALLAHGANYEIQNKDGKMPVCLTQDEKVADFLKFVEGTFRGVKNGKLASLNKLKPLKNDEFLAVTNCRNNHGNTLLLVATASRQKALANKLLQMQMQ